MKKNRLFDVIELTVAALALGLGFLAWKLGMFMNFVFVLLLALAPVNLIRVVWRAWRKEIYWEMLTKPFAANSHRYYSPCLARIAFFAGCGFLLEIAVVPFQFPDQPSGTMRTMGWALALLQIGLSLLPARRISWSPAVLHSIGAVFMLCMFMQIVRPPEGEATLLNSPLRGVSCVVQGGNSSLINHHYPVQSQRQAVDIFKVAETMEEVRAWKIMGMDASFGQTIFSPCDGRVAHVEDSHPDNEKGETDTSNAAGNYVTLQIAQDRFILIAHVKSGSIIVKPGDVVKLGQALAQCGNSGNTSGPHVHLQSQSLPTFSRDAQTFPIGFCDVIRNGERRTNLQPRRNDLLLQSESLTDKFGFADFNAFNDDGIAPPP